MITIKHTSDDVEDFPWVVATSGESVAMFVCRWLRRRLRLFSRGGRGNET